MKTVAVIQARLGSTRLPGKVLKHLDGITVLERVVTAVEQATGIDEVYVATTTSPKDGDIAGFCHRNGIKWMRGSEEDVLSRFMDAAKVSDADVLLRLTADCPFLDPKVISEIVALRKAMDVDYCSNIDPATWPDGLDTECFTRRALEVAHKEATRPSDRDCVTRYISRNRYLFKAANLTCPLPNMDRERWVLDAQEDYEFCVQIAARVKFWPPSYLDILAILEKEPELRKLNRHLTRNERFYEGISTEPVLPRTYEGSKRLLKRAEARIPLGAQTFSKSKFQYPDGSPLFVSHGDGAYIYDVDGNDYVDLVSALLPNILGYRDVDVDRAVRNQLDRGISLSLSTDLEAQLAERLCQIIPCAEMVRFGKTGSDVTTAAVRLARRHTNKQVILSAGYHGWHGWSISQDGMRAGGVPYQVKGLVHTLDYGDFEQVTNLLANIESVAAIIVEPETNPDYLKHLRKECNRTGTVLIFDEVITGFRWHIGGAQTYWNVTPDLACFGKAMGNGLPISALVGKRDIMKKLSPPDNIFFSGTFFGECLSLAGAIATIDKLQRENVVDQLHRQASALAIGVHDKIRSLGLSSEISLDGPMFFPRLKISDNNLKEIFIREMAAQGVLIIASHNLTFAHKEPQIKRILTAYDHALGKIAEWKQG